MELLDTSAASLARAAGALRAGAVIAYPTETVYGLGADPFNPVALARLFEAKERDPGNPVLLIVDGEAQLVRVAAEISPRARAYMEAFWPGPLSLLVPGHPGLPETAAPRGGKVCVRCPGSAFARALCTAFGGPITSTSANRSGAPPVRHLQELDLPGVTLGIDAGYLPPAAVSTIVDAETGAILREGAISRSRIEHIVF